MMEGLKKELRKEVEEQVSNLMEEQTRAADEKASDLSKAVDEQVAGLKKAVEEQRQKIEHLEAQLSCQTETRRVPL